MNNLLPEEKKLHIVEKRKKWFAIPIIIISIAVAMGILWGFVFGSPLNLDIDFTGGYSITVTIGQSLTTENQDEYEERIESVFDNLVNDNGVKYDLSISDFTLQGEGSSTGLYVLYTTSHSDTEMEDINEELEDALNYEFFADDIYAGNVTQGDTVSASVSGELLINALCAIILAVMLMLLYIAFRFELLSGFASIICLVCDILMMLSAMVIFHVSISVTFIAALITILGYSINNTIIIFDKIRDLNKNSGEKILKQNDIANKAIQSTMVRSINTAITTMITILMVALASIIFGVTDMLIFCFPLIIGLLSGTFSSIFLAPSIWAYAKEKQGAQNKNFKVKKVEVIEVPSTDVEVVPENVQDAEEVNTEAPDDTADKNDDDMFELISEDKTE